ncbi:hypothetical protein BT96DRAFT_971240 [Gymnopus androsaceus JB14]|uniref:DUF6534 domain-containing protein n=1 Tax=Gymnopus androsaceus JB14 TaxID=1447944 RepID=A0A6A4IC05_9AGAR|nr:hypothetical protein BT96DRAFT_971240 [Gymnopus androsaceus JB14]
MASSSSVHGSPEILLSGPFFGMLLSAINVGIVGTQTWTYFHRNNQDSVSLKLTVAILFLFILTTNCLNIATTFDYTISHFGLLIDQLPRYFIAELVVSGIPVFIVDVFFASRIYYLNRCYRIIACTIVIMAVAAFASGCVTAGFLFQVLTRESLDSWRVKSPIFTQNILRACTALISSTSICWVYRSSQATTKRTKSVLQKIVHFTVTRGILLAVAQVTAAVMFMSEPQTLHWMIPHMMLDKIYVITMLAMLNTRANCRQKLSLPVTTSDFLRRSTSNSRSKNITFISNSIQATIGTSFNLSHSEPSMQQSDSEIDLESIRSAPLSGILVSQEKITAVDYVNSRSNPPSIT